MEGDVGPLPENLAGAHQSSGAVAVLSVEDHEVQIGAHSEAEDLLVKYQSWAVITRACRLMSTGIT